MSAQSGVPQARAHSLTVVTLNQMGKGGTTLLLRKSKENQYSHADESHSAHKDLTNAHGVPRKQRTTSRKRGRIPESLILATQQARGSQWLQTRGHGIPIMTGDPTQTHEQHKTQGQEDLPVHPKPLKHVRVKCSLESNARRGFAWKVSPPSQGQFVQKKYHSNSHVLSTMSLPLVSNRTTTIATLISVTHKARSLQCTHHINTLKHFTKPKHCND